MIRKLDIKSGETIGIDDKNMFGTDAFGPKLGPFLANLHGQSDNNVIDIWNVRGMNRRFGNMFIRDQEGNILTNKEGNIMVADQPRSQKERAQFIRFMNEVASLTNLSVRDAQAILWYYEQGLYTKLGVPSEPKNTRKSPKNSSKNNQMSPKEAFHRAMALRIKLMSKKETRRLRNSSSKNRHVVNGLLGDINGKKNGN